ncbi:MAG TPA: HAD family phosphatase [Bacteroidetes bacterium]|nr:HAD family phosphatase [Bacteroidota bacterium]
MHDTIIFDLGGVLIDWNPGYVFDEIFAGDEERKNYFFNKICTPDWNEEQDAGRSLQIATDIKLAEFPGWETEIKAFYGRWEEMLGGPIQGTVDIFKKIKNADKYRIYALTNWSAETFPVALERFGFLQWFDGIVVSGTEKTRKPFPRFYNILFERYNVLPERAVFIDDNFRNVEAGKALGLAGIHFQSPEKLAEELNKLGLLYTEP